MAVSRADFPRTKARLRQVETQLRFRLRMISAQTHFCVCRDGIPVPTFLDHALSLE
jgi:hypothetical protein